MRGEGLSPQELVRVAPTRDNPTGNAKQTRPHDDRLISRSYPARAYRLSPARLSNHPMLHNIADPRGGLHGVCPLASNSSTRLDPDMARLPNCLSLCWLPPSCTLSSIHQKPDATFFAFDIRPTMLQCRITIPRRSRITS